VSPPAEPPTSTIPSVPSNDPPSANAVSPLASTDDVLFPGRRAKTMAKTKRTPTDKP